MTGDREKGKERDGSESWRFNADPERELGKLEVSGETQTVPRRQRDSGNALGRTPGPGMGAGQRVGAAVGGVGGLGKPRVLPAGRAGPQRELLTLDLRCQR